MDFENSFSVDASIDRVWTRLLDVQAVAPCVPGASLTEVVSDTEYRGTIKIKLGAVQVSYKGSVVLADVDEQRHSLVLSANGNEARGTGAASGTVRANLTEDGPNRTTVHMASDVAISGRVAQFGRNIIQDVSNRLIADFARCLEGSLSDEVTVPVAAANPAAEMTEPQSGRTNPEGQTEATSASMQETTSISPRSPTTTPPMGMPGYSDADLKLLPLLVDVGRARAARGLRALAKLLESGRGARD